MIKDGEGNGTPLQYSCLENRMDGGAWWAAVHGVAKSRTWLSDFTFTFQFHALEKEMVTHSSVLAWGIPGTGEPGGLPSMGSHRVRHDWSNLAVSSSMIKDKWPYAELCCRSEYMRFRWYRAWLACQALLPKSVPLGWQDREGQSFLPAWDSEDIDTAPVVGLVLEMILQKHWVSVLMRS